MFAVGAVGVVKIIFFLSLSIPLLFASLEDGSI